MSINTLGIIPARWASSRFPGKPLADIHGKPMIWHVYQRCLEAACLDRIVVATDDRRIADACDQHDMDWILTKDTHLDCLDRSAEVASKLGEAFYVTVQGDEPCIDPAAIRALARTQTSVACGYAILSDPVDWLDPTIPKVVTDDDSWMVYMSRAPIPYFQRRTQLPVKYQVCVYRHTDYGLSCYAGTPPTQLEKTESIGLLRYLTTSLKVKMVRVPPSPVSVDTPADLERAREILSGGRIL